MTRKILGGILLIVVAVFAYDFFLKTPSFNTGAKAPDFSAQLINGDDFALSDLKGNFVLLDFWGSWCAPCRKEIPSLKGFYAKYHDQEYKDAGNFHIVSVALEKSSAFTERIIKNENLNWDHHIIDVRKIVMMSEIGRLYDVKDLPTKFLINPEGQIIGTNLTFDEMSNILDKQLKS